ncbi:MAG TPA: sulfotransferase [Gemmatimonadaceae bacterium]|nr:sulfotransferase [Gemmatimonadaceae bacterium]
MRNKHVRPPVFIIGVGRSGSSVFHRTLCQHPHVAWLSRLLEWAPRSVQRNRLLMHALDFPWVGNWLANHFEPSECYAYWDSLYPGFSEPVRDLVADDVSVDVAPRIIQSFRRQLTDRRSQLVVKITGWSRLDFLYRVFPDARFIHILRDGRPVAASFLRVDWWDGWRGPNQWRYGPLTPAQDDEWRRHNLSFIALAAIQWKILMDAMESAKRACPQAALLELRYEDCCDDPMLLFRRAAEFCELPWLPRFERAVGATRLRSENDKWRRDFTPEQQGVLDTVLHDHLVRYGYADLEPERHTAATSA